MDVDDRRADAIEEAARQDLHVAREHDQVEAPGEQLELALLGRGALAAVHGDVLEARAQPAHVVAEVGVVGDHEAHLDRQLAAPPAPEQVEQAVVLARDEDRHALGRLRVDDPPLHAHRRAHLGGERVGERGTAPGEAREVELHAQEEAPALVVGRILVGLRDVGALLEQEPRHRRDDPGAVAAHRDQAPHVGRVAHAGASTSSSQRPTAA